MSAALSRHIQMTWAAFLSALPDAIQGLPLYIDGDVVVVNGIDNGRVLIRLTQKSSGALGNAGKPALQVDFTFENMSQEEARMFMQTYDAHDL